MTYIVLLWYYIMMPRKIRELIQDLKKAGFVKRGGKSGHRNFKHPRGVKITISGKLGDDAKQYQERALHRAIEETKE